MLDSDAVDRLRRRPMMWSAHDADPSRAGESRHRTRAEGPRLGPGGSSPPSREVRLAQGELKKPAQHHYWRASNGYVYWCLCLRVCRSRGWLESVGRSGRGVEHLKRLLHMPAEYDRAAWHILVWCCCCFFSHCLAAKSSMWSQDRQAPTVFFVI